jgi:uncharacterized protein
MTDTQFTNPLEVKLVDSKTAGEFAGLAAAYSLDSHGDVIRPGAFAQSLQEHKAAGLSPPLLWSHDLSKPVGRVTSMAEDEYGLSIHGKFNLSTDIGRNAYEHAKAEELNGLSIGHRVPAGGAVTNKSGVRTLQRIDLKEISLVTLPSNKDTRIRQVKTMINSSGELERMLREGGLSKRAAESVVAYGYAGLTGAPPEDDEDADGQREMKRVADLLRKNFLELKHRSK